MTETFDAQIVSNQAGTLESLHPKLKFERIGLTLGSGFGNLQLHSIDSPMFFVSPQAGYEFLSDRLNLFANGRVTIIPKTDDSVPMQFVSYEGGGTYDLHFNNFLMRAGVSFSDFSPAMQMGFPETDFGVSILKGDFTVFAQATTDLDNPIGYRQMIRDYRPVFHMAKAGMSVEFEQGSMSFELTGSRSTAGATVSASYNSKVPIEVYSTYRRNFSNIPLLGSPNELMIGLQLKHPKGELRIQKSTGRLHTQASKRLELFDAPFMQTIIDNPTLDDLVASMEGAGNQDLIVFASNLAQNVRSIQTQFSSLETPSVFRKIPGESNDADESYRAMHDYYLQGKRIPPGICANATNLTAEFLRRVGFRTFTASINLPGPSGHSITLAFDDDKGYIVDWNKVFSMKTNNVMDLLAAYERDTGTIIQRVGLYGKDGKIRTFERTPSGELLEAAAKGSTNDDPLRDSLTRKPLRR